MEQDRQQLIRALFDEYIEMYASRDDRLTEHFSENFTGYTGGGDFLVKNREQWVGITRQDFSQVPGRIRIEMRDLALQDLSEDVVSAVAFFHIHLPTGDNILSSETARLDLVFRREGEIWRIAHSGISIPYHMVQEGEVYPLKGLQERNSQLEKLVEERTRALEAVNNRLELLSNTDGLTGIANRRSFDRLLEQEWSRGQRTGSPLALIMLDVDHFKLFNDRYGHLAGDDCLRALAQALGKAGHRAGEVAARYGGEEFVVLLPDSSVDDAVEAAQRIQHEVRLLALPHADSSHGIVTFSLGVASLVPGSPHMPEELIRRADLALYRAKQSGRNCIQLAAD